MLKSAQSFSITVAPEQAGYRLDVFLAGQIEGCTRSAVGKLISDGNVLVGGKVLKGGYRVRSGDVIEVAIPAREPSDLVPEQVEFSIIYEDEEILVLNKPPGLVVHPAAGNRTGTLAHGLLFHCDTLPGMDEQRPGIVHRLDKETSGIMLVAKSDQALRRLSDDFHDRRIQKVYHAVLLRSPRDNEGRIAEPIGRHPVKRKKMAVRQARGRFAATKYRVLERFASGMCFVELDLETGRTHQIRVHMSHIGCPVAGDSVYGGLVPESFGIPVARQLLHASILSFTHPVSGRPMTFSAPLWPDMQLVLDRLRDEMVSP